MAAANETGGRLLYKTFPDGDSLGSAAAPLQYDTAGFPAAVPGLINAQSFNGRGEPLSVAYANGVTSTLTYNDPRDWLTSISHASGAGVIGQQTFSRAATGRIDSFTSAAGYEAWSYGYDDLDRLTSATDASNAALNQTFTYDDAGRMATNSSVSGVPPPRFKPSPPVA